MTEWSIDDFQKRYRELELRRLTSDSVDSFLADWSALTERADETRIRLCVATTRNTSDEHADNQYRVFLDEIYPHIQQGEQRLKQKLLSSGLQPHSFEFPLRKMREEAALFRDSNVSLLAEEENLSQQYNKIIGAQVVEWEAEEVPLGQLSRVYEETDRDRREAAWRLCAQRRLADRSAIDLLWAEFMALRIQMAANAGHSSYVSFRWKQLLRIDYTPADAKRFHVAVEKVVVPAVAGIQEARRRQLGVKRLRPWDLDVDPLGRVPLRPFRDAGELCSKTGAMLHQLDPDLGTYFDAMRNQELLDLESRKHKAPGGYCETFPVSKVPFIFMNATGVHADVQTLLHESGHAFHIFEVQHLPYYAQRRLEQVGMEFAEVASMAMELLAAPYLVAESGGFYSREDSIRARLQHLEKTLLIWAHVAAIDAFQHWIYENPSDAIDPRNCNERFSALWQRFMPAIDWTGLEEELGVLWHSILHIHLVPFYMIEYGLAQMGAVQVMTNALQDQRNAVSKYRDALSLGATRSLSDLYEVAGAKLAFDSDTLAKAVATVKHTIASFH